MSDRRAMWPIDILLGLLVFVGVSSSVSPWFDDLYTWIAWPWGACVGAAIVIVWLVVKEFGPDIELNSEIRKSQRDNGRMVQLLATAATNPEAAKELAARRILAGQEQLRVAGQLPPAPTPPTPTQG